MIKDARLKTGATPSEVSGQVCDRIEDDEPMAAGDTEHPDPGLKAAAAALSPLIVEERP